MASIMTFCLMRSELSGVVCIRICVNLRYTGYLLRKMSILFAVLTFFCLHCLFIYTLLL